MVHTLRSSLKAVPLTKAIKELKMKVKSGDNSNIPLLGLGNEEEVKYYSELVHPIDTLYTRGHSHTTVSSYDLLSLYLVYTMEKTPHIAWYEERLRVRP